MSILMNIYDEIKTFNKGNFNEFNCFIDDCKFIIRDTVNDNLEKIKLLFYEYMHPHTFVNCKYDEFIISNVVNENLVDLFFSKEKFFIEKAKKIQTFKDETYHYCFIFDDNSKVFFSTDEKTYLIFTYENNYYLITKNNYNSLLVRIVREIYLRHCENAGDVVFHGGGFSINNSGFMVCGDKAKGKTTIILQQLLNGYDYLSNDRIIVSKKDNRFILKYFPLSMRIGIGTINSISAFENIVNTYNFSRPQSAKIVDYYNNKRNIYEDFGSSEKLEITPKEIKHILASKLVDYVPLKAIIFPEIDVEFSGINIEKCSLKKAKKILSEQCMTPHDENWIEPWLFSRLKCDEELEHEADSLMDLFINVVPSYIVHFGLDAYKNWNLKIDLKDDL